MRGMIALFFFRDKSYIGWEGLFIGSQSDLPISSLMYELTRILITILMMIMYTEFQMNPFIVKH